VDNYLVNDISIGTTTNDTPLNIINHGSSKVL